MIATANLEFSDCNSRYKGTAFPISVLTSKAEQFMAHMPVKPQVNRWESSGKDQFD